MSPDRFLMNVSFTSPIPDCLTFAVNREEARKEIDTLNFKSSWLDLCSRCSESVIPPLCFSSALSDLRQEEAFNAEF